MIFLSHKTKRKMSYTMPIKAFKDRKFDKFFVYEFSLVILEYKIEKILRKVYIFDSMYLYAS